MCIRYIELDIVLLFVLDSKKWNPSTTVCKKMSSGSFKNATRIIK